MMERKTVWLQTAEEVARFKGAFASNSAIDDGWFVEKVEWGNDLGAFLGRADLFKPQPITLGRPVGVDTTGNVVFGRVVAEDTSDHPAKSMTVGDLRKALEGVPDDVAVVRADEGYSVVADSAALKQFYEANDDDFGHYIDPNGPLTIHSDYEGKPTYPVFVID